MQTPSEVLNQTVVADPEPVVIEKVELRTVRLPLTEPFETSFGRIDSRLIFLVAVDGGGQGGQLGRGHRNSLNFEAYFRLSGCRKVDFINRKDALEQVPGKMKPLSGRYCRTGEMVIPRGRKAGRRQEVTWQD